MMRPALVVMLALLAPMRVFAGSYISQATFTVPISTFAGMDADAVGNLYLLGMAPGATTYQVTGEATQGITPQFSFDTGLSSPTAFAVEGSGVIDILNSTNSMNITLTRYTNPGTLIGQASYFVGYLAPNILSMAIDKVNERVYIANQYTYHPIYLQCLGCGGPSTVTKAVVAEYDFSGNLIHSFNMPGADYTAGSCYTPTALTVDPQGNLYIADGLCQQLLKYTPTGSLTGSTPASSWSSYFNPHRMWTDPASNVYISESVCSSPGCPPGVVKLGSDASFQTSVLVNSPVGCAWDQRILYLASSGASPLRRFVFDGAASVPAESGPFGMIVQHSSAAALSWQASSDPDGDPVTYTAYLGTNPTQLSSVGTASQASFTTQALTFGVTYYWQIVAQDSYLGLPLQQTPAPVESFNLNLVNHPPLPFAVVSGTGTAATRATSATLSWQAAVDPDGDPVVYDVLWGGAPQSMALLGTTDATSWPVSGLAFGATYYWTVRARDVYNATIGIAGGTQTYRQVFLDTPPPAPTVVSGVGSLSEHTLTPSAVLSWNSVANAQGDPIAYRLSLGSSATALNVVQDGPQTGYAFGGLAFGTTYYWQVTAYDPFGGVGTTPPQTLVVSLQDSPPQPFPILGGTGTLATRNTSQLLSWAPAVDPDGDVVSYDFALSSTSSALPVVQSSTATSFTLSFQFGTTYYWQVTARDGFGGATASGVQSFLPTFLNHPPSAPPNLSPTGDIAYHGFAPSQTFNWGTSIDPEGDPITYQLLVGSSPTALAPVVGAGSGYTMPVALNTTYYYEVTATDIYGAASPSPINWFEYQFFNRPPQAFAVISGSGTVTTRSTSDLLAWSPASDPDGDAVTYGVFIGTNAVGLPLASTTAQTAYALGQLAFGTTYYWRVDGYDGFGGTTTITGGQQALLHVFADAPPSAVVYQSTASVYAQHTLSPVVTLSWAPSSNVYGDPVSYQLQVRTSSGSWPVVALGQSTQETLGLQLETTYFWQVTAADPYGGASTGSWMSFIVHLANRPPYPIAYTSPATITTRVTSAVLSWADSGDPDGDPVAYSLYLSTNPAAQYLVQTGTATTFPLSFQFGTTYYWYVTATDSFGAETSGSLQSFLPIFKVTSLSSPTILSGNGTVGEHTLTPSATLSWASVVDADGDSVSYRLVVGTNPASLAIAQDGQGLSYNLASPLFGTTYYWQVTAYTAYTATLSSPQSLNIYLRNSPPQEFAVLTGTSAITTRATSQLLSWQNAVDPDGDVVTYDLAASTNPGALSLVQSSTATSFTLTTQFGTTYYWQVTARDPFGGSASSGLQSLAVSFWNPSPTVPFNQSKTGTIPYHGFSPTQSFFWQAATDPAGDPITYSLAYGTDSSHLAISTGVPLGFTLPVPLNTAFYYSVIASGLYGASSPSPVNWVYYQFSNNPPGPFDVLGTTGTVVTRQTGASISWTTSVDPDGDPVSYGVFMGTSPAALAPTASTTRNSAILSNLAFGTTYYWRVDAYDGFGGTTTANEGVQSLLYQFYDPAPNPVVYLSTATSYSEHTTAPIVPLSWTPSSNAASDPISYRVDVQASTGSVSSVMIGSATTLALSVSFGTTYYWRVAAVDPYGGASTGPWLSFTVSFLDSPPPAPVPLVGAGSIMEHALAPSGHLAWSSVQSPYGDPVTYQLFLGASSSSLAAVRLSSPTAFDLPSPLFGTTYYWQISAVDPYGYASTSPLQGLLLVFQNNPPGPFSVASGTGTLTTRANSQVLSWTSAVDPDGDSVTYALSVGTAPTSMSVVQRSQATSYTLGLQFGTTYYWTVAAFDGFGGTTTLAGAPQVLMPVFQNDPPSPLNVVSPFTQSPIVKTMRNSVTVTWDQVSDPEGDPITYTVYFGDSGQNMTPLATVEPSGQTRSSPLAIRPLQVTPQSEITTDSTTVTLTLTSLDYYKTYYLRVSASNPYGATTTTPTSIFTLASPDGFPKAYNYPNPFNPNRGGTNIVFNAPPSGYAQATVEVYSEWQALLFKQDYFNIPPGISQVHFDGRDRFGRAFFNGSYICRVRFSGPDDKQVFYLLVVK